jgi:hypothetical protein
MADYGFVTEFFIVTNIVLQMVLILLGLYSISFIPTKQKDRRTAWFFMILAWTLLLARRGVSKLRYEEINIVASFFIENLMGTLTTICFLLFAIYIIKSRKAGE